MFPFPWLRSATGLRGMATWSMIEQYNITPCVFNTHEPDASCMRATRRRDRYPPNHPTLNHTRTHTHTHTHNPPCHPTTHQPTHSSTQPHPTIPNTPPQPSLTNTHNHTHPPRPYTAYTRTVSPVVVVAVEVVVGLVVARSWFRRSLWGAALVALL